MKAFTIFTDYAREMSNYIDKKLQGKLTEEEKKVALDAYNRWEEDEHDGCDYIFDIEKTQDLKDCVEGGLTAVEIARMVGKGCKYFCFGTNHEETELVTDETIINSVRYRILEIVGCALLYPNLTEYSKFINAFFTKEIMDDDLNYDIIIKGEY